MKKSEIAKRYLLFIIGLFFSGLGVAFTKHGGLGVSPISSIPNVISFKFTFLSMGNWLIIFNMVLLVGQIIILRKKFQWIQLMQIPLSFLFGYFTDFGLFLTSFIPVPFYPLRLLMVIIGVVILGFGVSLTVIASVVMNSGEAIVKAISDTVHREFGNVKVVFDVSCVLFSVILSLLLFKGKVVGAREGTVISAVCTGFVVKFFNKLLRKPLEKLLK